MADKVLMEQGATIIPRVRNEPDEIEAAISLLEWTTSARARRSARESSLSYFRVCIAASLTTRCVDTDSLRRARRISIP